MTIEFSTRDYVWSHGKAPRGLGSWCFTFEGHEYWVHAKYSEAKKECIKEIRRLAPKGYRGLVIVTVEP